jgi:hypothetical protein
LFDRVAADYSLANMIKYSITTLIFLSILIDFGQFRQPIDFDNDFDNNPLKNISSKMNQKCGNIYHEIDSECKNGIRQELDKQDHMNATNVCRSIWNKTKCIEEKSKSCEDTIYKDVKDILENWQKKLEKSDCKDCIRSKCSPEKIQGCSKLKDVISKLNTTTCGKIFQSSIKECVSRDLYDKDESNSKAICCEYWKMTDCLEKQSEKSCNDEKQKKEFIDILRDWKRCQEVGKCDEYSTNSKKCNSAERLPIDIFLLIFLIFLHKFYISKLS